MRSKQVAPFLVLGLPIGLPPLHVANAKEGQDHVILRSGDVKWEPAPAALPPGAQAALLFGDPAKDGPFALRVKFPAGYHIPPHSHPVQETVTVISGSLSLGMGKTADREKAQKLTDGGFFSLPADHPHYAFMDEETVIQITTNGPWGLNYVNPEDDPRQQKQAAK